MIKRCCAVTTVLLVSGLASTALQAHFFAESANCKAPVKPLEFVTELDKKEFEDKVNAYRSCLETFVQRQNEAMEKHKQGAEKAAAAWKQYAETVLKATLKSPTEEGGEVGQPAPQ